MKNSPPPDKRSGLYTSLFSGQFKEEMYATRFTLFFIPILTYTDQACSAFNQDVTPKDE